MQKYERRKCQRFPIKLDLKASRLYKQDHVEISGIDADIRLVDISRTGIGFLCEQELPLNYYFDTKIDFMGKDYFYCVIKIVRIGNIKEDGKRVYGAEFVGLAPFLADKIDQYGRELSMSYSYKGY